MINSSSFQSCHLILQKTEQKGGLYLGSLMAANDHQFLKKNNIKAILTAAAGLCTKFSCKIIENKVMNILDVDQYQISKHFEESFKFLEENLKLGSVLVHCAAGISRSATIVIAYLMKKFDWSFDQAFNFVKQKRSVVCPNQGFVRQLRYYSMKLQKQFSQGFQQKELLDYQLEATQNCSVQVNSIMNIMNSKNILLTGRPNMSSNKGNKILPGIQKNKKINLQSFSFANKTMMDKEKQKGMELFRKEKKTSKNNFQILKTQSPSRNDSKMFILSRKKSSSENLRVGDFLNKLKVQQ